jgi:hypothetical protein
LRRAAHDHDCFDNTCRPLPPSVCTHHFHLPGVWCAPLNPPLAVRVGYPPSPRASPAMCVVCPGGSPPPPLPPPPPPAPPAQACPPAGTAPPAASRGGASGWWVGGDIGGKGAGVDAEVKYADPWARACTATGCDVTLLLAVVMLAVPGLLVLLLRCEGCC